MPLNLDQYVSVHATALDVRSRRADDRQQSARRTRATSSRHRLASLARAALKPTLVSP